MGPRKPEKRRANARVGCKPGVDGGKQGLGGRVLVLCLGDGDVLKLSSAAAVSTFRRNAR